MNKKLKKKWIKIFGEWREAKTVIEYPSSNRNDPFAVWFTIKDEHNNIHSGWVKRKNYKVQ